jgi:hypothetical protein
VLFARGLSDLLVTKLDPTAPFIGSVAFPSVLFWGSGVLKEVPLIFAMGLLIYALSGLSIPHRRRLFWLLPSAALLTVTKPYVFITLIPALAGLAICLTFKWRVLPVFASVAAAMYFMAVQASVIYPPGDLLYILAKKQTDFYNVAEAHQAGSTVAISPVSDSAIGFLTDLPERLTLTYLRPFPTEASGLLQFASVIENLIFVGVIFWLFRLTAGMQGQFRRRFFTLLTSAMVFAIVFGSIAGSTVPVLGAIVRYKLPVLMFIGGVLGAGIALRKNSVYQSS